jgi:endonuclease-8
VPEGPSIVILKEEAAHLVGMRIRAVEGNTRIDKVRMLGKTLCAMRSWGKHFLLEFGDFSLRVHFLLYGSYRVDARREDAAVRLSLQGAKGELNLYACSLRYIEGPLDAEYDWTGDVMNDAWDPAAARRKLKARPGLLASDALLEQDIFAGVGNIIKNEVLFRIRVQPLSEVGALSPRKLGEMIREARVYSFEFLEWKKHYVLRKHWLVHTRSECPRCHIPLLKGKLGVKNRRAFYCGRCQKLYRRGTLP